MSKKTYKMGRLAVLLVLCVGLASVGMAADIYVDVNTAATTHTGTLANPFLTIQEGVNLAAGDGVADTVNVAAGTYAAGAAISGDTADVTVLGAGAATTLVTGPEGSATANFLVRNQSGATVVTVDGFGCSGALYGVGTLPAAPSAINLNLLNTTITGTAADGIVAFSAGTVNVTGCTVTGAGGTGVNIGDPLAFGGASAVTLTNTNVISSGNIGVFTNFAAGALTLTNCNVDSNVACGLELHNPGGPVTINGGSVSSNGSHANVFLNNSSVVTANNVAVDSHPSAGYFLWQPPSNLVINGGTANANGNRAVYFAPSSSGAVCAIDGLSITGGGTGIFGEPGGTGPYTCSIANSTIVPNGHGVEMYGPLSAITISDTNIGPTGSAGVMAHGSDCTIDMTNVDITGCPWVTVGFFNWVNGGTGGSVTINGGTLSAGGNHGLDSDKPNSVITVDGTTISGMALRGIQMTGADQVIRVSNTTVTGNVGDGAVVLHGLNFDAEFNNCTIDNNQKLGYYFHQTSNIGGVAVVNGGSCSTNATVGPGNHGSIFTGFGEFTFNNVAIENSPTCGIYMWLDDQTVNINGGVVRGNGSQILMIGGDTGQPGGNILNTSGGLLIDGLGAGGHCISAGNNKPGLLNLNDTTIQNAGSCQIIIERACDGWTLVGDGLTITGSCGWHPFNVYADGATNNTTNITVDLTNFTVNTAGNMVLLGSANGVSTFTDSTFNIVGAQIQQDVGADQTLTLDNCALAGAGYGLIERSTNGVVNIVNGTTFDGCQDAINIWRDRPHVDGVTVNIDNATFLNSKGCGLVVWSNNSAVTVTNSFFGGSAWNDVLFGGNPGGIWTGNLGGTWLIEDCSFGTLSMQAWQAHGLASMTGNRCTFNDPQNNCIIWPGDAGTHGPGQMYLTDCVIKAMRVGFGTGAATINNWDPGAVLELERCWLRGGASSNNNIALQSTDFRMTNSVLIGGVHAAFLAGGSDNYCDVINNTFVGAMDDEWDPNPSRVCVWANGSTSADADVVVQNNLFYGWWQNCYIHMDSVGAATVDINNFDAYRSGSTIGGADPMITFPVYPDMADAPSGTYDLVDAHPQLGSPLINGGVNNGLAGSLDYDGNERITGTSVDIGAFEFMPHLVSIVRDDVTPTESRSLSYTVTFDNPVIGVDATDFALGGTILDYVPNMVPSSGAIYRMPDDDDVFTVTDLGGGVFTVVVDILAGAGSMSLDLHDDNSITAQNVPLNGSDSYPDPSALYVGEVYDITDTINPDLLTIDLINGSPTSRDTVDFRFTFTELMEGPSLAPDSHDLGGPSIEVVTQDVFDGKIANVAVTLGDPNLDGTVGCWLDAGLDMVGLPLAANFSSALYTIDNAVPIIWDIVRTGGQPRDIFDTNVVQYTVIFDMDVTGADATDFVLVGTYLAGVPSTYTLPITAGPVVPALPNYEMVVTVGTGYPDPVISNAGTLRLDTVVAPTIFDAATGLHQLGGPYSGGEDYDITNVPRAPAAVRTWMMYE